MPSVQPFSRSSARPRPVKASHCRLKYVREPSGPAAQRPTGAGSKRSAVPEGDCFTRSPRVRPAPRGDKAPWPVRPSQPSNPVEEGARGVHDALLAHVGRELVWLDVAQEVDRAFAMEGEDVIVEGAP